MKTLQKTQGGAEHRAPRRRGGFTIVEVLIVVAVIVILAAIVVAVGSAVTSGAKQKATEATLGKLNSAMILYLKSNPEPSVSADSTGWVVRLKAYPDSASIVGSMVTSGNSTVKDGWGNDIYYIPSKAAPKQLPFGVFWSYGKDGLPNTADDVFSSGTAAQP